MQPPSPAALSPGKRSTVALGIAVETSQHCAEVRAQRSEPKSERAALIDNPVTPAEVRVVVQRHRVTGTRLLILLELANLVDETELSAMEVAAAS